MGDGFPSADEEVSGEVDEDDFGVSDAGVSRGLGVFALQIFQAVVIGPAVECVVEGFEQHGAGEIGVAGGEDGVGEGFGIVQNPTGGLGDGTGSLFPNGVGFVAHTGSEPFHKGAHFRLEMVVCGGRQI